jgi:hypothetical protein
MHDLARNEFRPQCMDGCGSITTFNVGLRRSSSSRNGVLLDIVTAQVEHAGLKCHPSRDGSLQPELKRFEFDFPYLDRYATDAESLMQEVYRRLLTRLPGDFGIVQN